MQYLKWWHGVYYSGFSICTAQWGALKNTAHRHSGCFQFGAIVNKAGEKINNVGLSIKRTYNMCLTYATSFPPLH